MKSGRTLKLMLVECVVDPLVATMVAVYVPDGVVTDDWMVRRVLPFDPTVKTIFLVLNELANPTELGDKVADNDTLPLKPKLFTVIVLVVEPPATKLGEDGAPAIILKSDLTVRDRLTECTRVPLAPVTVNT
jgi:hypothetical protein